MMGCLRRPKWPSNLFCVLAAVVLSAAVSISPSDAQQRARPGLAPLPDKPSLGTLGERINTNTIAIVSGNINSAWLTNAYDLSAVLDRGDDFRVLPVIGRGGEQNVRDVRYLKGVDLGITVTPVLTKFRASGELGNIDDKIVYITKLFNQEMHVLVRADAGITSLEQLRGKTVNFSDVGSATQQSAREVFRRLNIDVKEVNTGQADAYEAMKRGEMAATVLSNAMPAPAIARLRPADGFRLIPVPYSQQFHEDYYPAAIAHEEYPNLIPKGQSIDTIAYGSMIIAYNWPKNTDRYRRIAQFVDNFFTQFNEFQKPPRHPKWREVNLAANVPGWRRFEAAEEWLTKNRAQQQAAVGSKQEFDRFLAARPAATPASVTDMTPADRERLFQDFVKWSQAKGRR
jgi:TRAP-type uncharacterized transport system substrate-binding protein